MQYVNILTETNGPVGLITLNRPKVLNALNTKLMQELGHAVAAFEANDDIAVMVITGNDQAFAAGADIAEMQDKSFTDAYLEDFITRDWEAVAHARKPVIAAVAGYALGGGCELAMMCDFIIAAETARFGQPEIKIGAIPGAGGTQRLTRFVGKAKAMEMCLSARMMDAEEAERSGLVSRVVPPERLMEEVMETAGRIAGMPRVTVAMAKEAVNRAYETTLSEGVRFERRLFHSVFATEEQKEGMRAFMEKRKPEWRKR